MLILPSAALAHLAQESRRLTACGVIVLASGRVIRSTQFDEDLVIADGPLAGTYASTAPVGASDVVAVSDLSVSNLEVQGVLAQSGDDFGFTGFSLADVEAGNFRNALFTLFICQWDAPDAWQKIVQTGTLGQIKHTSDGVFTAEWRGLSQALQQNVGRVYSELCDVRKFCDARCGLNIADFTFNAEVTAVTSRREFTLSITDLGSFTQDDFSLGTITFVTGLNQNTRIFQIKQGNVGDTAESMELWEDTPNDIQVGDSAHVVIGCDRRFVTCQKLNNTVNFRGHGFWVPGMPKIIRAPP